MNYWYGMAVLAALAMIAAITAVRLLNTRTRIEIQRVIVRDTWHEALIDEGAKTYTYGPGDERVTVGKRGDFFFARYPRGTTRPADSDEVREWRRLFEESARGDA